ncbi:MAG: Rpn family recombination-promoting nuclease/putative transposase [Mariprofundaceae bacterium]|nr:Rpn family recombination-promoting nuclease/putative transposase [Mariprofundaceae bacterium]
MTKRKLVSFDWAMKKMLRSKANFAVLEGFLSELLYEEIKILEVLESESNKENAYDKSTRVDLKVRNSKQEIIIIEVQYGREYDYMQRILYGVSKAVCEHISEGEIYAKISKVISVNILHFDLGHGDDYVYHGTTNFLGLHTHHELRLNDVQQKMYKKERVFQIYPEYYLLKVNQFDDVAKDTLDEWIYFLKNEEIKNEFTAKGLKEAKQMLDVMKLPASERHAFDFYTEERRYQASMFESSYGVGMLKGEAKGRVAERFQIAKSLLTILDDATISTTTGLNIKQVCQLRSEK